MLAEGITELDDAESYRVLLNKLREEKAPVGMVETLLVESIALDMTRLRRARRLEAEYLTGVLNPPTTREQALDRILPGLSGSTDPGLPAVVDFETGQRLVSVFQRYETTFLNRMLRLLHELERIQRIRSGERLPAPSVVDVSVHASAAGLPEGMEEFPVTGTANSVPAAVEQPDSLSHEVGVDTHADSEIEVLVPRARE